MRARPHLLALALLGLSATACGALDARLEARTVCFTLEDYPIPGAEAEGSLVTEITYDLGGDLPILSQPGVHYSLALRRLALSAAPGAAAVELGGVEVLEVSPLAPAGAALPEPVLVRYLRSDPHPAALSAAAPSGVDLAPYLAGGEVTFRIAAQGAAPAAAWAAHIEGCFLLKVDVDYGKEL